MFGVEGLVRWEGSGKGDEGKECVLEELVVWERVKSRVSGSSEGFQNKRGFELGCCQRRVSQQRGR